MSKTPQKAKLSKEVLQIARKLQELVDKKYRGKAEVIFHPEGEIMGVRVEEFHYMKSKAGIV
ncbi:hypothetical protein MYX75_00965 [Acidobacteria bacterium AH-259-A15]|nr:hypothetical protein [Acidobacteria bacterium AH-259-A15]